MPFIISPLYYCSCRLEVKTSCIAPFHLCSGIVSCHFTLLTGEKRTKTFFCIHQIASGGYYGFCFVTPLPPPPLPPPLQCVETFHRYHSNKKKIIASFLKFAGYIHNHKILPGNIFGLILKNKMATLGIFLASF